MRERQQTLLDTGPIAAPSTSVSYRSTAPGATWVSLPPITCHDSAGRTEVKTCSDVSTPDAKKKIADGLILNNPFRVATTLDERPETPVAFTHNTTANGAYGVHGYRFSGQYIPFTWNGIVPDLIGRNSYPSVAALRASVIDQAVTSAFARADASEMLAWASTVEMGKTIESADAILRRVAKITKDVRKFNVRSLSKQISPRELADRWMEARYAIRPLIYDMNGIVKVVTQPRRYLRRTFRGSASNSTSGTLPTTSHPYHYETVIDISHGMEYAVSAHAGVLCDVDVSLIALTGGDQLFESLWEVVPYSFIIDWFANVGETIAAWTPNAGVTQLASWVTVKETFTSTNSSGACRSTAPSNPWSLENTSTTGSFTWQYKEQVLERLTAPQLSVWPQSKLRLDTFKLLDLSLILRNLIK